MKKEIKSLRITCFACMSVLIAFMGFVEYLNWSAPEAVIDDEIFIFQTLAVFFTLGGIFAALRFMKFKPIKKQIEEGTITDYFSLSIIRMSLLINPALCAIVCYFLFPDRSFTYLFYMVLVAFLFVIPSEKRYFDETGHIE